MHKSLGKILLETRSEIISVVILGPNCPMKGGEVKEEGRIQSAKVVIAVLVVMSKILA